jgi:hypothetical protein
VHGSKRHAAAPLLYNQNSTVHRSTKRLLNDVAIKPKQQRVAINTTQESPEWQSQPVHYPRVDHLFTLTAAAATK